MDDIVSPPSLLIVSKGTRLIWKMNVFLSIFWTIYEHHTSEVFCYNIFFLQNTINKTICQDLKTMKIQQWCFWKFTRIRKITNFPFILFNWFVMVLESMGICYSLQTKSVLMCLINASGDGIDKFDYGDMSLEERPNARFNMTTKRLLLYEVFLYYLSPKVPNTSFEWFVFSCLPSNDFFCLHDTFFLFAPFNLSS